MKNTKIIILTLVLFITIYCILSYIFNNYIINKDYVDIYVLNDSYLKNEEINLNKLKKIKVKKNNSNYAINIKGYLNNEYNKNTILTKDMLLDNIKYTENDKEYIAISFKDIENIMANQVNEGNIVNIYYTAKLKESDNIFNNLENSYITSTDLDTGEATILLFENIKIEDVYNNQGNSIEKNDVVNNIVIQVNKDQALIINNIRNRGFFSLSIVR